MNNNKFGITWLPLWKCNFKCPYCTGWKETNALEFQPLNTLITVWDNVFHKIPYTEIDLHLTGGEPTIYPNFFELLKYFITKVSKIHVCTNLSFNAHDFLNLKIPPDRISLHATFHPSCISIDDFIENLILLKKYIINDTVEFVADENNLKNQELIIKKINDCKIKAKILFLKFVKQDFSDKDTFIKKNNFSGTLNSDNEIKMIKKIRDEQKLNISDYESFEKFSLGKKCSAGYKSIYIMPNGNIRKCSMDSTYLGNIFDCDINIYTEPQICTQKVCSNQYHNILE